MTDSEMITVSNIMEELDFDGLNRTIGEQILNRDNDYITPQIDHLTEVYDHFCKLCEIEGVDRDDMTRVQDGMTELFLIILSSINDSFDTDINPEDIMGKDLPGISVALYRFFVVDFYANLRSIMCNYIKNNLRQIHTTFADLATKKDIVTATNKKILSEEMAVIASNLYDITDYIFTMLDPETAVRYCDEGYIAGEVILQLLDNNTISGDFIRNIADKYKHNVDLRAKICFDILHAIRDKSIPDTIGLEEA
ncbi:MAG: hypothetical protein NC548_05775 [Lachnospiraceae bacterium]|nr:hypothetical protein [Lachnospiraceae bacterium]